MNTVERMFRELPEGAQRALADLPDDLRLIEVRTLGLRTLMSELEARLDGDRSEAELVEVRGRLGETVSGLERIRLRLEAVLEGVGTVDGVTEELEAAREIGEVVDGFLEGRGQGGI